MREAVRNAYHHQAKFPEIHLSLTALAPDEAVARGWIGEVEGRIREAVPAQIFGADDDRFAGVIGELLRERGFRMATAESCTGGLVAAMMTDVAGSSDYVDRGFVTYTEGASARLDRFPGSRDWVRTLTAYVALERLRRWLLGLDGELDRWAVRIDEPYRTSGGDHESRPLPHR